MEVYLQYLIMLMSVWLGDSVERGFVYCPAYPCTCESADGVLIINCRNLYLSALPKFLSFEGRIKELSLRHNSIKSLPENGFLSLHIEKLDIVDNAVSFIHNDAFVGLENSLKWLSIQVYAIDGFPAAALSRLSRLRYLMIVGCKQQELTAHLFVSLTMLEELHLIGCRIKYIKPGTFSPLTHLNTLVLAKNALRFQNIPEINLLYNLIYLDLSFNDIQFLENMAFAWLSKLRNLKLRSNKLRYIANQAFYNLDFCLEELDLSSNSLKHQDLRSLANLKVVRSLDLSSNRIVNLSGEYFGSLKYLTSLRIAHNNIKVIARGSFRGLASMSELLISYNPLQVVERGTFLELSFLEHLNINNTKLGGKFRFNTLEGLSASLTHLDVSNSSLISSDVYVLSQLTNLTYLDISHNIVTSLDFNVVRQLTKLQSINLSHNNISSFVELSVPGFDSGLKLLDLSWNNIQTIHNCSFFALKELSDVLLEGNPLSCNCSLAWLYRWIQITKSNHHQENYKWTCKSPDSLDGVYFTELAFSDFQCSNSSVYENVCPASDTLTHTRVISPSTPVGLSLAPVITTERTVSQFSVTAECETICLNISRLNLDSVFVQWLADNTDQIFRFDLILKRQNDSSKLQSVTVSSNTSNYTLHLDDVSKQDVCVVAINKDLLPLTQTCHPLPPFANKREEGSRKQQMHDLIHNSFLPLLFVYISGSLSLAILVTCLVLYARKKRKSPKRVKPICVAYPAWLDHRTSAASSSLTHEPHFLNTLFLDNASTQDSRTDALGTISDDILGADIESSGASLPVDFPISLSSRRESGMDTTGIGCAATGNSESGDDFFFHF